MFELVNTSVPVGLIPGTRGFTNVAMTRGMPEVLQKKVEQLAAYSFRVTSRSDSYIRENPVNYFYYLMPQGERYVGRVSACEFDYTGRTNRLAHILAPKAGELAGGDGVSIIIGYKEKLDEKWEGEPRYLDNIDSFSNRDCRELFRSVWSECFGSDADTIRQAIAGDLEARLREGKGKTIYFKATTAWDYSGEKLLCLYGGILEFVPQDLRDKVTFSTYGTNVPSGSSCLLCAVFDETPAFVIAKNNSAWVDCGKGELVNGGLLKKPLMPSVEIRSSIPIEQSETIPRVIVPNENRRQTLSIPIQEHQFRPEDNNRDSIDKWVLLGGVAALVLAIVAVGYWFVFIYDKGEKNVPIEQQTKHTDANSTTNVITNDVSIVVIEPRKHEIPPPDLSTSENVKPEGESSKGSLLPPTQEEGANTVKTKDNDNVSEETPKVAKPDTGITEPQESVTSDVIPKVDDDMPFLNATEVVFGSFNPSNPKFLDSKAVDDLLTFRMENGNLVREDFSKRIVGSSVKFSAGDKNIADIKKTNSPFILYYAVQTKVAYWDWSPPERGENDTIDFEKDYFNGIEPLIKFANNHKDKANVSLTYSYNDPTIGEKADASIEDNCNFMDAIDLKLLTKNVKETILATKTQEINDTISKFNTEIEGKDKRKKEIEKVLPMWKDLKEISAINDKTSKDKVEDFYKKHPEITRMEKENPTVGEMRENIKTQVGKKCSGVGSADACTAQIKTLDKEISDLNSKTRDLEKQLKDLSSSITLSCRITIVPPSSKSSKK